MKKCILLLCIAYSTYAQKRPLDFSAYKNWPNISSAAISADGKYVGYLLKTGKNSRFMVQDSSGTWKMEFADVKQFNITPSGNHIIFQKIKDTLGILDLQNKSLEYIPQVKSYKIPETENANVLFCSLSDSLQTLLTKNLATGAGYKYTHVTDYSFNKSGRFAVIQRQIGTLPEVFWLDTEPGNLSMMSRGSIARQIVFDGAGLNAVFITRDATSKENCSLRLYSPGMDSAAVIAGRTTPGMEGFTVVCNDPVFNNTGDRIGFRIEHLDTTEANRDPVAQSKVTILGPNETMKRRKIKQGPFFAIVNINETSNPVHRIQQETEKGMLYYVDSNLNWVITASNIAGDDDDYKSDTAARPDMYLVNTQTGERRLLAKRAIWGDYTGFSPAGRFLIWFDRQKKQWFTHNIALNVTRAITRKIPALFYKQYDHANFPDEVGISGWLPGDKFVLVNDRFDIWKIDPDNAQAPVNLTLYYGSKNQTELRYIDFNKTTRYQQICINPNDTLLLSAFDTRVKNDGFFQLNISDNKLVKIILSANTYTAPGISYLGQLKAMRLQKAGKNSIYLCSRMSTYHFPNLYLTSDFKIFKPVTNFAPQQQYNWMTSEFISWEQPDGIVHSGTLFKPENFNPHHKYPVLFYYYEKLLYSFNVFINPELSNGPINIPWFVSNGYLVFVPQITYQTGYPGRSAFKAVVAAAEFLSKKPWVDPRRMGLQGHSFGGFETSYIVAHSHLFAAACTTSGSSELSSLYASPDFWGPTYFETGQGRIGATLWGRADLYHENSAVYKAEHITTPLLICVGGRDIVVPCRQGIQLYNILYRARKKAWLINYENEEHVLKDETDCLDYSIRLGQFFGHYLKGEPLPDWMN